jgi:hypothetical protein
LVEDGPGFASTRVVGGSRLPSFCQDQRIVPLH